MLGGVCGGLAEYFNVDPSLVRIIFVILACTWGGGLIGYLILWFVLPMKSTLNNQDTLKAKGGKTKK